MSEYTVLTADNATDLSDAVDDHLSRGFGLVGGVSVTSHYEQWENARKGYMESETFVLYAQAVAKP